MTAEDLRKLFIKVAAEAVKNYPASQYFCDDGKFIRHGFTCGGYHLWLRRPTRGDTHFEIGPVPITKVKPTEHLLVGAGTLPYDEVKAGMVTPRKLQFYWDMLNAREDWTAAAGVLNEFTWWYSAPGLEIFRSTTRNISIACHGNVRSGEGTVRVFDIPAGAEIPADKLTLVNATPQGTPPVMLVKNESSDFYGCVRAGEITKVSAQETLNINIAGKPYTIERRGGKFTIKEKDMKFDIPTVKQEPTKVENEKVEPETTNPPVVPVAAEKPEKPVTNSVVTSEEVAGDDPEPTLRERLEKAFSDAETLKTLAAELLKELRPILKEVAKLEKGAADSTEIKELRSKNKTLEAENNRLKGAVKLLSEKL